MYVKICGLKTEAAVAAALAAGADALGFVFAESPRRISPEQAAALTADVPADIAKVAVMLRPSVAEWNAVREVFKPDWLQADADDFALLDVPENIGQLPVYRDSGGDFSLQEDQWPEHILFEGARSGVGELPDWDHAAQVARHTCLVLAGGLTPQNIQEAIFRVHPWAVDVSSGVESSPGVKDPEKIAAFVKAAKEAEVVHGTHGS
jgi:phosphoribosylanthranilate isomerase